MYDASPDPYCYPASTVLRNKLKLADQAALNDFEADAVTQRGMEPLPSGRLTPTHLRAVHHHLFQDVYSWAGRYRTVRIGKGESIFCYPEHIASQLQSLFGWLHRQGRLTGLAPDDFAERGGHFLSELNAIHPFRDGNGRAQMAFFAMLSYRAGHPLNLDRLQPAAFLAATITAFNGDERRLANQIRGMI